MVEIYQITISIKERNLYMKNEINIENIVGQLSVDYKDASVLTTSSKELELVDYCFKSITCNDEGIEKLLYECVGSCLCRTAKLQKAFIFKGEGRNGKGVLAKIIEKLLGEKQCSHEHLEQLSGSRLGGKTTIKALMGCTANIVPDQGQPRYVNTSLIKSIIAGDTISVEQKREGKIEFEPYATMIFLVNDVIDFKETGLAIKDRFIVINFNAVFTDENNNRNINIAEELCQPLELQIIATRAIQAFSEVLKNGKFTIPSSVEEETKRYFLDCNSTEEFCELFPIKEIIIKSKYYDEYRKWCNRNNKEAVSNAIFGKRVLALGYRPERYSFGNNRHTYYASPTFKNCDSIDIYHRYLVKCCLEEEQEKRTTERELNQADKYSFSQYLWRNIIGLD